MPYADVLQSGQYQRWRLANTGYRRILDLQILDPDTQLPTDQCEMLLLAKDGEHRELWQLLHCKHACTLGGVLLAGWTWRAAISYGSLCGVACSWAAPAKWLASRVRRVA